jgi:hypothetical protein
VPSLSSLLWHQARPHFAILDAARAGTAAVPGASTRCLYDPGGGPGLEEVAPHLVDLAENRAALDRLIEDGWGRSWGVYLSCSRPFEEVWNHLRQFLKVKTESGEELYFRFYDPRVLRVYLPTCTDSELEQFFGPIEAFWVEAEDAQVCLVFRRSEQGLVVDRIDLNALVRNP